MALEKYKAKRHLDKTPEPAGGKPTGAKLQFVVQKHNASHLHYDFRLELHGVLKSWAVPKGPSMNSADKRLAMAVEDHPWDYKDFEGIIPKGNYGAGTVIVWDNGTFEPQEKAATKKEQEKILTKEFYAGALKIVMHGKKLKGAFTLVKTEGRGENAWLLTKQKDRYGSSADITKQDKSVISRKTIEQMAANKLADTWQSNHSNKPVSGKKATIPASINPMLCTLTKEVISDGNYIYEIKWDGYRIIAFSQKGKTVLASRSGLDYSIKYPPVVKAIKDLGHDVVLDGEVVVFNEKGLPDFDALQKYNGHITPIAYCVFDVLWLDGNSLMDLPIEKRKGILQKLVEGNETLKYSDSFDDGKALFDQALKMGLEGIVAKKKGSAYIQGERGNDWLKTPARKRQEFVIGGWAESEKSRAFRSLLFGAYEEGQFRWIGRSGGGYKDKEMPGILKQLKALEIEESPFVNKVLDTKGATLHYVKPELVANFEFATWTKSGRIRKPATFLGFRKDKKASQVVREVPKEAESIESETNDTNAGKSKTMPSSNWPQIEKIPVESKADFNFGDCSIELTNVEREIWKGIPKAKLIEYYHAIAPLMLPYLKNRPQSLHVKPVNANAPGLYIKDMEGRQPSCATIFTDQRRHTKKGARNQIDYLVCNNEATLLWMVNLGCIDINPWSSRTISAQQPDYVLIDLDPTVSDEKEAYLDKLLETAMAAKEFCNKNKLKAFAKTSGKTGIHFYLPCTGLDFTHARAIAEYVCAEVHKLVPDASTCANSINSRGNKVYIDPSQNDYADTLAAPYSARPFHIPTVSTPLEWKEINSKLNPSAFTIETLKARLAKKGDLFKGVLDKKVGATNSKILTKWL